MVVRFLQKYVDELRNELGVDTCVLGRLIMDEPAGSYVKIINESLTPGLSTRMVRHEIDHSFLKLVLMGPKAVPELDLIHRSSITIHDVEKLRLDPLVSRFSKLEMPFPERAIMAGPVIYRGDMRGVLVCSQLEPRQWDEWDRQILEELTQDIGVCMELLDGDAAVEPFLSWSGTSYYKAPPTALTFLQREVLLCFEKGLKNKNIAVELAIPYGEVRHCVLDMLRRSGCAEADSLTRWARLSKLLSD